MNSILKSNSPIGKNESAGEPQQIIESLEVSEEHQASAVDKEDTKFVAEFGWLAAASVTIASIAASIGIS